MIKEIINNVGKIATIEFKELQIEVEIVDVKKDYGRTRYLVKPVAGTGETWIEKLTIINN